MLVRPAQAEAGTDEDDRPGDRRDRQPAVDPRPSAAPPDDRGDEEERDQQVGEWEAQRESEQELPGGDDPARHDPARPPAPVAPQRERQRERNAAARDDLHVPVLLQAEGRERERGARHRRAAGAEPELAGQQVGAHERERVGEQEHQVVAEDGGVRARADQPGGGVADERVGEGEGVAERPELVGVEEVERLVGERVAVPCHLVGLGEGVAQVLGDVVAQVQDQGPVHDHRDQASARPRRWRARGL